MFVSDHFIADPDFARAHALSARFHDWSAPDGETYRRICITEVPGLRRAIEQVMGPVDMLGMAYRLNFGGEMPNAAVHSDIGWGTHACVLYLSDGPGGTAFWRHKKTGADRLMPGDEALFQQVRHDWNRAEAWEMTGLIPMQQGRGVIYESTLFHSRWPFEAFGEGPDDGRLIAVAFFTPRSE